MAWLLASFIRYKKVEPITKPTSKKFDIYEKSAIQPAILVFFITVTFGGIATFLPLYTVQQGVSGIQWYFFIYAAALMVTRIYAGQIYDQKGHQAIYIPSAILITVAMLLLAWMPNNTVLFIAAILYGLGFGSVQPALQAWAVEKSAETEKEWLMLPFFPFLILVSVLAPLCLAKLDIG